MFLLHVRFKVDCEIAEDQQEAIWRELPGNPVRLSDAGDSTHFLVPFAHGGAAALLHSVSRELSFSFVEDYGAVRIYDLQVVRDDEGDDGDEEIEDLEDYEEFHLGDWWAQYAGPRGVEGWHGFRRCGLLLVTDDERRDDCSVVNNVRRGLGPDHGAHWHGRNSIFLTFWHDQTVAKLAQGSLGRLLDASAFSAVYGFEMTNDFAAKHATCTLASWFSRGPGAAGHRPPHRPRPSGPGLPRLTRPTKPKSFQVETKSRRRSKSDLPRT
ncbi:MAG TPA: hypothetical protein VF744_14595 [Beijerinckiaceae bacterium]|jgi:hypothetical protein